MTARGSTGAASRCDRVESALARSAARWPEKNAVVHGDDQLTYGDFAKRAERLAEALAGHGIRRGDRVVLWLPNGITLAVAIYAVLRCGGVFVALDPTSKPDRIAHVLGDCDASAVVAPGAKLSADLAERFRSAGASSLRLLSVGASREPVEALSLEALHEGHQSPLPRGGSNRDLACLVYTSGSTGKPKGVMSAHHNVLFAVDSIVAALGTSSDDVVISPLPLSFDYGLYQLLMSVECGATLVLESFAYPAAFLAKVDECRGSVLPGVPTMWAMLVGMDLSAWDLQSLRTLTNTGAALPVAHIKALTAALPRARMFSMYGLTETKRTLILHPEQLSVRPDSVGQAIPGTEVWLVGADGARLEGEGVGELWVRGGHVMLGYWNAPEASVARFPPGPLPGERVCRTGDLFRRDADGYYYFVARTDDVLKIRGQKVAPHEVESALHSVPGVGEAAVVGVADEVAGQSLRAYVVRTNAALTEVAVRRFCRHHLADFEVPESVVFVDSLPRSSNGKVARDQLQRLAKPDLGQ